MYIKDTRSYKKQLLVNLNYDADLTKIQIFLKDEQSNKSYNDIRVYSVNDAQHTEHTLTWIPILIATLTNSAPEH